GRRQLAHLLALGRAATGAADAAAQRRLGSPVPMVRRVLTWAVTAGLLAAAAAAAPAAQAAPALPLGHAGRFLVDGQGRVVVLHGYNMVYKRPPYDPEAVGFGDDDAAFLAAEGYDAARVGVIYKALEPSPGSYDDG